MDDYALQQELEALAGNAFNPAPPHEVSSREPIKDTAARWQRVFNIPEDTVIETIMTYRNDLTRTRVSEDHWEAIRTLREAEGYDREAYEYELDHQKKNASLPSIAPSTAQLSDSLTYLIELSGPLDSAEKVQHAAKLKRPPQVMSGESIEDDREVELCCVDGTAKAEILRWASGQAGGWQPMILVDPRSMGGG